MAEADETARGLPAVREATGAGAWQGVLPHIYKVEGEAPFRDITRQVLFADPALAAELRYFEMAPGGYSTLERHEHVHAVMIHRGHGRCLVGSLVRDVAPGDLVFIPPLTWHQFRAPEHAPMGFLCMVNAVRDRPHVPNEQDLADLRRDPAIAEFIAV